MCPNSARQTGRAPASFGATCTEIQASHCSQHAGSVSGQKAENTVNTGCICFLFLLFFVLFPLFSSTTDLLPWMLFSCLLTT